MRNEFFLYYVAFGHSLCYMRKYAISARRISNMYSGFLLLASTAGVVTLSCWDVYPAVWSLIAFAAQVLQALLPLTQAAKQRIALKYIIQDRTAIFSEIEEYWRFLNRENQQMPDDDAISAKIQEFERRKQSSEDRFGSDVDFPLKKRLYAQAEEENTAYFWYHYHVKPEKGD